jgi:hypothetical protein
MTLASDIREIRERVEGEADEVIKCLRGIAHSLSMTKPEQRLGEMQAALGDNVFTIVVCGRFKNGKSSLLNALLGQTTSRLALRSESGGPMPVDDLPATATVTRLVYAAEPYVRAWRWDGGQEDWSFERYLREARISVGLEDNSPMFEEIREFEVGYPAELLESGVMLVDSPGTSEDPRRTETTRAAVADADAAIVVYRTDALAGMDERSFASEVTEQCGKTFTLVNRMHGRPADDRLKAETTRRLGFAGVDGRLPDLAAQDVHFVDVRTALEANLSGNEAAREGSGMAAFERRVFRFLVEERYQARVKRIVTAIDFVATTIERQIQQRRAVLQSESERLDAVLDECRSKVEQIEARRTTLQRIVARTTTTAKAEVIRSFERLADRLYKDIEDEFAKRPIPSLQGAGNQAKALFRDQHAKDAMKVLSDIVAERTRAWAENGPELPGLQQDLSLTIERMQDDLRDEVRAIEKDLKAISLKIAGLDHSMVAEAPQLMGFMERLIAGALGYALMGPFGVAAAAGGWRGLLAGTGSAIGTGLAAVALATAFGVALGPIALAAIVVGAFGGGTILGGMLGIEKRVRAKALETFRPKLRELGTDPAIRAKLEQHIEGGLRVFAADVSDMVGKVIEAEKENIANLTRSHEASHQEKLRQLAELNELAPQAAERRAQLKELLAVVRQVA